MTLNNKNIKEAVATATATSPLWGPKALGLAMTGVGALGTYLQSRKKKEKKSDSSLLDAVRKKQAEIQQDVANQETLKKNQDFQDAEKKRGKQYVTRKRKPENEFYGEGASIPEHVNWMMEIIEDAPPGAKYERMVKHIKKSYKKDGKLTDEEKSIAYATAWKNYNNKNAK